MLSNGSRAGCFPLAKAAIGIAAKCGLARGQTRFDLSLDARVVAVKEAEYLAFTPYGLFLSAVG
jgi:hypothetical protein